MRKFFTMLVLYLLALCLPACATTSGSSPSRAETYQPNNFLISNQTGGLVLKLEVEDANGKAELRLADRETYTYERPSTEPIVFGSHGQRAVAVFTVTAFERTEKSGPDTLAQVGEPIQRVLRASDLNWFWNVHRSSFGLKEPESTAVAKKSTPKSNVAPAKLILFVNNSNVETEIFNSAGTTIARIKPGDRFAYTGPDGAEEHFLFQLKDGFGPYRVDSVNWDHTSGTDQMWPTDISGLREGRPRHMSFLNVEREEKESKD